MRPLCIFVSAVCWITSATAGATGVTLRKGNGPEIESLDPHKVEGVSAGNVVRDLFEGLVAESPDGSLVPGAAESWTVSENRLAYTFTLRANARWSNGDIVRAEDFVAGLRRSIDPATGSHYSQILAPIENAEDIVAGKLPPERLGVEAVDARTLTIRLKGPTPYLLGLLVHSSTFPIHRASIAEHRSQFAQPGNLVSNGAYRLLERVLQSHVLLERNPFYWDDANTQIDRVKYVNTEDLNSEFKRFRAGELDWTYEVPASQRDWIWRNMRDSYHAHTYLGVYYYGINLTQPPFKNNPKLRHALSLAIDRNIIVDKVLGLGEKPAETWVPPGVTGHRGATVPWVEWNRERRLAHARKLYAEAGYSATQPARVEIRYNTHDNHKKVATAVAAMWTQWLGVEVQLINEEWKAYLQSRRLKARTQVFRAGWIGDYNDANSFLEILHSAHGLNDSGYANTAYDALLEKAAVEVDPTRRAQWMQDAEALLLQDLPVIPIYFYVTKRLVSPRVQGWQGNIMDHHATRYLRLIDEPRAAKEEP